MIRLLVPCLVLWATAASAQVCTPQTFDYLRFSNYGESFVPASGTSHDFVPDGEVWLIRNGGIGTDTYSGPALEYALQIERAIYGSDGAYLGTWLTPLMGMRLSGGTPMLALDRTVILLPRERLSARVNSPPATLRIYLMYVGWKFPAACLSRLLGVEAPISGVASPAPTPDLSALVQAAQSAAQQLQNLAAAVPPQD